MPSQTEGRLSLALKAYHNQEFKSLRAAAKAYDVPPETLRTRHLGVLPRAATSAASRLFTHNEEEVLLRNILQLCAQGQHPQRAAVEEMANTMLRTKQPSKRQKVGTKWVANFVKRHSELSSVYNRKLDYQRAQCEDPKLVSSWFKLVGDTIAQYGVVDEDIYNFDETGFQMGVISTSKVITTSERKGRPRTTQLGNREWVTAIEAVNAKGWAIPAFIIFAAKLHQAKWYQVGLPETWRIAISDNGWTTDEIGTQWIHHFHKNTKHSYGKWRLLIFDGHGSHQTDEFIGFCRQNHILTLCIPTHTSHILQPLDVSCFSPLKKAYSSQVENKLRLGINHITKEEFLPAFFVVHQQAMTVATITSSFRATGLVPFNPTEVLSNLGPVYQATLSPGGSQVSFDPKTPRTLSKGQKQTKYILTEGRKRRRSSVSSGEQPLLQLLKGFEAVVHEQALLKAECAALRAENQHQKQKRARYKGTIQKGRSMTIQEGQQTVQDRVVTEQLTVQDRDIDPVLLTEQQEMPRKRAPAKCSKCNLVGHTVRTCSV